MDTFPTYKEAKRIVENAEVINEGTENEFIKGCYGNKYRDAVTRLGMTWLSKDE